MDPLRDHEQTPQNCPTNKVRKLGYLSTNFHLLLTGASPVGMSMVYGLSYLWPYHVKLGIVPQPGNSIWQRVTGGHWQICELITGGIWDALR